MLKHFRLFFRLSGKSPGDRLRIVSDCEWDQKQKHKKQPWSNVECFAFGGATVRFASVHAANHTIPPPPSYEGYPLCPKDKNLSPFHGEKPLMITWFLGKKPHQISQSISHGRDVKFHVRVKWLILNMVSLLWADVKYHVLTRLVFVSVPPRIYPLNLCMGELVEKKKNSHRFFGIFIRLNLCEINGSFFEPCSALSNF